MKSKIVIAITALVVFFSSCNLEDENTNNNQNYFIKAKVDGELVEYRFNATATLPTNGNKITGYAKAVPNQPFPSIDFEISDPTGIKVQNYAEPNNNMILRVAAEGTVTFTSQNGNSEDFKINITEITNSHIKGTFSGTVFLAQNSNGANFSFTDGEFYLKRKFN